MTPKLQMTITKGWRSGWRCERIRDEVGDSTLTDKEISNQLHTLIPKWFKFVHACKVLRKEPLYHDFMVNISTNNIPLKRETANWSRE